MLSLCSFVDFCFTETATTEIYTYGHTLSLHDALPIYSSIDPVGACVGMKGSRVQAVVQEMQGEKIDIIPWSPDTATFVVNALQPASVSRVVLDEEEDRIEVVVPDDQLSLAIGRRGQNVRLASQLTGKAIDILTEDDASEKRQREFIERSEMFQKELDVDETLAQLLVAEGFGALEEVAYVERSEEHTSELQSIMRISYAAIRLKNKPTTKC